MYDRSALRHVALVSVLFLLSALPFVLPVDTLAHTPPQAPAEQGTGSALQVPLEPSQLPKSTILYLIWRGTPPAMARSANNLLSLWDDPEFAPVRSALAESLLNNSRKSANAPKPASAGDADSEKAEGAKPQLTQEDIAQISSLLENPFVLGYFAEPAHASSKAGAATETAKPKWNGFFFVYNRSGKEQLLAKTAMRLRASQKELPKVSAVTLAGIPALKIVEKDSTTYWAEDGRYAISANEAEVFEHLVSLLEGKTAQTAPLTQTAAYQEARPIVGTGVLEFFLRVPDVKEFVSETDPKAAQVQTLLSALKLDSVHSVSGHLVFDGSKTRITGAILGDASPGTLFDLWEEGQAIPASLAYVPPEAVHYQESQFSLLSLYKTVKHGLQASSRQGQQGMADLFEAMIQTRFGMPLPDALGLLSGEFASLQTSPTLETKGQTYFIGIRDKQASLKLLRALLGDRISSERNEGDTTYLKFSLGGSQGNAGVMQWNFFHLAVTPNLILASSRRETLQQEIANRAHSSAALPASFQTARSQFPEKLNGVSFLDFQKLDWQALKDKLITESGKTSRAFQEKGATPQANTAPPTWLLQFNPQVIPRHLRVSTSASWKDSKGIHFDGWIE
jgi:hypothetical protein